LRVNCFGVVSGSILFLGDWSLRYPCSAVAAPLLGAPSTTQQPNQPNKPATQRQAYQTISLQEGSAGSRSSHNSSVSTPFRHGFRPASPGDSPGDLRQDPPGGPPGGHPEGILGVSSGRTLGGDPCTAVAAAPHASTGPLDIQENAGCRGGQRVPPGYPPGTPQGDPLGDPWDRPRIDPESNQNQPRNVIWGWGGTPPGGFIRGGINVI
jgi:hypothetical protein